MARAEQDAEIAACTPIVPDKAHFNRRAALPYGLKVEHIRKAMVEFADFLGLINRTLHARNILRLETMLMQANFSSMVGEFMVAGIPKSCRSLRKNTYHNGHPDLVLAASTHGMRSSTGQRASRSRRPAT